MEGEPRFQSGPGASQSAQRGGTSVDMRYLWFCGQRAGLELESSHGGDARAQVLSSEYTGFSSEIGTKLREWAVGQAGGSCYSRAAMSSNDSKTLYGCSLFSLPWSKPRINLVPCFNYTNLAIPAILGCCHERCPTTRKGRFEKAG